MTEVAEFWIEMQKYDSGRKASDKKVIVIKVRDYQGMI